MSTSCARHLRRLTIAACLSTASAVFASTDARAWVPYRTVGGVPIQWRAPALIEVAPAPPLVADPVAMLRSAYAPWVALPCDPPSVSAVASETAALDATDLRSSVVWFTDKAAWDARFSSLELARTIIIHKVQSGTIVEADIAVNLGGFQFAAADACDPARYDLQGTLTHELGHFFGLDHSEVPDATMARRSDPGDCSLRTLTPDDEAGFCATYDRPDPVEPEPDPEPGPEVVEPAPDQVEAAPRDEGCSTSRGSPMALAALAFLAALRARTLRK